MNTSSSPVPFVSIVIPCRNEARHISACLDSVLRSTYPSDRIEVLVVDGQSDDGTIDILTNRASNDTRLVVLENPARRTPQALNLGIQRSRGEVIVRMDAHALYPASYVAECVACLRRTGAMLVGGPIYTAPGNETRTAVAIARVLSHSFGVGNSRFRTASSEGPTDTVPFGAYRREVFDRLGLFDERLHRNQDNELNSRITQSGGIVYMSPTLASTYMAPASLRELLWQGIRTGWWNAATVRINRGAFRWRHFVPGVFVAGLAGLGALSAVTTAAAWGGVGVMAAYAAAAAAASAGTARSDGVVSAAMLPALFFLYHTSYGLGVLGGVVRSVRFHPRKLAG